MDARRHRTGSARHLGDTDKCVVCGADYIVTGGNQRYCPNCAPSAVAEKDRQQSLEWYAENKAEHNPARNEKRRVKQVACTVCGKLFDCGGKPTKVCSRSVKKNAESSGNGKPTPKDTQEKTGRRKTRKAGRGVIPVRLCYVPYSAFGFPRLCSLRMMSLT